MGALIGIFFLSILVSCVCLLMAIGTVWVSVFLVSQIRVMRAFNDDDVKTAAAEILATKKERYYK